MKREINTLKMPATSVTANPARKDGPMMRLMKMIAKAIWYKKKITELKFLGKCNSLAQSTCSRFASYPILNFLLQRTEKLSALLTIPNARELLKSDPMSKNVYPQCASKKERKNLTTTTIAR